MYAQGGWDTVDSTREGARSRSYFGVYTVRDYPDTKMRTLAHGTTLHGKQSRDPMLKRLPRLKLHRRLRATLSPASPRVAAGGSALSAIDRLIPPRFSLCSCHGGEAGCDD